MLCIGMSLLLVLGSVSGKAESVTADVGEFKYPETAGLETSGVGPSHLQVCPYPREVSGGLVRSRDEVS